MQRPSPQTGLRGRGARGVAKERPAVLVLMGPFSSRESSHGLDG